MPDRTFDVESYTVLISGLSQEAGFAFTSYRAIYLTSPAAYHDMRTRAYLSFYDDPHPRPNLIGVVFNVDQLNYNGQHLQAFLRRRDFADWYDMLRNEAPLKLQYSYQGGGADQPSRLLERIDLFTGFQEPPGEGPEDLVEPILATLVGSALATEGSDESTPASQ